jgi:hypothetical protein
MFDDTEIAEVAKSNLVRDDAYMLFYAKSSVAEFNRQSITKPDLWPHMLDFSESEPEPLSQQDSPTHANLIGAKFN